MHLTESDVRSMIRLLGETAALDGDHVSKKHFLLSGLCDLITADAWNWTLGHRSSPTDHQAMAAPVHDGFQDGQFLKLLRAIEHPDSIKAAGRFYLAAEETMKHTTMDELDMDPEKVAFQGELGRLWAATGFGPTLLSGLYLDDESMSIVSIYRSNTRPHFTPREKQMAHLILEEVPWLHLSGWPDDRGVSIPQLTSQERIVLNLLLEGRSRKDIGDQLGISEHTVSGYAKTIFRHFGVNSHPELMGKFLMYKV